MLSQDYTYIPSLKIGNEWSYESGLGMGEKAIVSYTIDKDTIINKKVYFRAATHYIRWLREDIDAKKIYELTWNGQELLLFDFDLKVGDIDHHGDKVLAIDTIFIFGKNRRRLTMERKSCCYGNLIEGIGNDIFGITAWGGYPLGMKSFKEGTTRIKEAIAENQVFSIFFNTNNKTLIINRKDKSFSSHFQYIISNLQGQIIQKDYLQNQDNYIIYLQNLIQNLYFIQIFDEQKNSVGYLKFVL